MFSGTLRCCNVNHYHVLKVPHNATLQVIRKAYKKKAMVMHPDIPGGCEEQFKRAQQAHEVLSCPAQRRRYDRALYYGEPSEPPAPLNGTHRSRQRYTAVRSRYYELHPLHAFTMTVGSAAVLWEVFF
eukprot:GEMP01056717.1.p1 GENE.GEMP01056717.1~~GEMP01056717.1.p1  ORF type:complete len:128 (-),score=11.41 GEMP01056717.1:1042-1425(-)